MQTSRRQFIKGLAVSAPGFLFISSGAATPLREPKPGEDIHFLLMGDRHFALSGDFDPSWEKYAQYKAETDQYCRLTAATFQPMLKVFESQASAMPIAAVIQVGDLLEGLAGSPAMAEQMTKNGFDRILESNLPPWIIATGNHECTGPEQKEAWLRHLGPYLHQNISSKIREKMTAANYSVQIGDVLIVCIDVYNDPSGFLDYVSAELKSSSARYKLVVLHPAVIPVTTFCWHVFQNDSNRRQRFLKILAENKAIVLCGHEHATSVVRRTTDWGPIVQAMLYSVVNGISSPPPPIVDTEFGPGIRTQRNWSPATLPAREKILAQEAKYVTDYFGSNMEGYGLLTLGGGSQYKAELAIYNGLQMQPYKTFDLSLLQQS